MSLPTPAPAILFTGHRIDVAGSVPRFPPHAEGRARAMILDAVREEQRTSDATPTGFAGGASGGDILFHEVCEELGVPTRMLLALPREAYVAASVGDAGADWVRRFDRLYERLSPVELVDTDLPQELHDANQPAEVWLRANAWMLNRALEEAPGGLTLIALWNGEPGGGGGGTADLVALASIRATRVVRLDATTLVT